MSNVKMPAEGGLDKPTRHPILWKKAEYYDQGRLLKEIARVFDICHGCRRCFNLCRAFPLLFDAIDESDSGELKNVDKKLFQQVVANCYLCDMCFMTKCPYVPPHPFNLDFPQLMLQAKAIKFSQGKVKLRDRIISNTDLLGKMNSLPVIAPLVNRANKNNLFRLSMEKFLGIHRKAVLPQFHSKPLRKRIPLLINNKINHEPTEFTHGRAVIFTTCYGNNHDPRIGEDLIAIFEHNGIALESLKKEKCCGMPKLEMGDLAAVEKAMQANIPELALYVETEWDIVIPMPSCAFMIKKMWPLLFPDNELVEKVSKKAFDPFEYLMLRHKSGKLNLNFSQNLNKIAYHVPCHLRTLNIGMKTRELLSLIPDTQVIPIERCSGHDGTYAVKKEFHDSSVKICKPVGQQMKKSEADYYTSDCSMAARHIEKNLENQKELIHPLALLRKSYGI